LKKGFSLLLSIIFMVVMALIGVMIMKFSASSAKHASTSIMDIRANLALRSATEYAILALQGHDFNNGRINEINLTYPFYNANIKFHYYLTDCNVTTDKDCSYAQTKDTNGSVLVYVTVTSKLPQFHIRKVKMTLQNP